MPIFNSTGEGWQRHLPFVQIVFTCLYFNTQYHLLSFSVNGILFFSLPTNLIMDVRIVEATFLNIQPAFLEKKNNKQTIFSSCLCELFNRWQKCIFDITPVHPVEESSVYVGLGFPVDSLQHSLACINVMGSDPQLFLLIIYLIFNLC